MSKNVRTPDSCIREFIKAEFVNSKEYTRQKCEWSLHRTKRLLEAAGFDASPYKIDAKAIDYLLTEGWSGHQVSYKKSEFSYLKRYLLFYKNDVPKRMKVVFPQDMRVNADWLEDDQYDALMAAPKTPLENIVIHLELCMGLRNVEVCRLMLNDIHNTGTKPYINVRGKGRGDGKYRSVRFHYMTKDVLARWMEERRAIVEMVIEPLRERLGFHFANHTLRRTFGRRLFHAEVPVETISKFLGHESTTETLKYIGVNLDDMDAGMAKLAQYDRKKAV